MTFEIAYNYMKSGHLLRQVINKLNAIDFKSPMTATCSVTCTRRSSRTCKRRQRGRVLHPPRRDASSWWTSQSPPGRGLLDPATGTGGFLVCAIEHMRKQAKNEAEQETVQECFGGVEKETIAPRPVHDQSASARRRRALQRAARQHCARPLRDWSPRERVDVIVTNPPFGGMEEDGIEANFPPSSAPARPPISFSYCS